MLGLLPVYRTGFIVYLKIRLLFITNVSIGWMMKKMMAVSSLFLTVVKAQETVG